MRESLFVGESVCVCICMCVTTDWSLDGVTKKKGEANNQQEKGAGRMYITKV